MRKSKPSTIFWSGLVATFLILLPWAYSVAAPQNRPPLDQLVFNHEPNGTLDGVELMVGFINSGTTTFFNVDGLRSEVKNTGRKITLEELGIAFSGVGRVNVSDATSRYSRIFDKPPTDQIGSLSFQYTLFDAERDFGLKKTSPASTPAQEPIDRSDNGYSLGKGKKWPLKLTRSTTDLMPGVKGTAQPAFFSYSRSSQPSSEQYLMQGALLLDFDMAAKDPTKPSVSMLGFGLQEYDLVPSLTFDKASGQTPSTNNVDSLKFGLGVNSLWQKGNTDVDPFALWFTANLAYATDFEIRQKVPTLEFNAAPIKNGLAFGDYKDPFKWFGFEMKSPLLLQFHFMVHLETSDVVDKGNSTTLKNHTEYVRLGPNFGVTFVPNYDKEFPLGPFSIKPDRDISLNVNYLYYSELSGTPGDAHIFDTALNWAIMKGTGSSTSSGGTSGDSTASNVTITLEYQDGITPIQLQKKHILSLGLGLKF